MKIISGGQTGADKAGLDAAKHCGFETGGWMPKGWIALDGTHPDFAEKYGLQEHKSVGYAPRTKQNVFDSDATLIVSGNFRSPGTILTIKSANQFRKKLYTHDYNNPPHNDVQLISDWIVNNDIRVLNVAGNSERSFPGIYDYTRSFLIHVFELVKNDS